MSDQYDRVLIRLSSAEDDKLEPILAKLLPLVFDELLTQTDAASRAKIVNVLNHVLTRAKGNTAIKLPVQGIAERWQNPLLATSPNAPFFRNLSIIFLDLGIPRLQADEQIDLALYSLQHFSKLLAGQDRAVAFLHCIPGLGQIASEGRRRDQVPRCLELFTSCRADDDSLVAFFQMATEFLLIPCGSTEAPSVAGMPSASWAHWKPRLKTKSAADMIALKTSVLKWLGSLGADPPASLIYLPSLVAMVENYDAVNNLAESNCKRLDPELDLSTDLILVGRLIAAGLTSAPESSTGWLKVEAKATIPSKLRLKVLSLLQRSTGIGRPEVVPYVVHLIQQSLRENEQVQQAALQLALVLAEHVDPECLDLTSKHLLTDIESVFWPGGGVVAMGAATPLAFRTFGSFARQMAQHPSGEGRALAVKSAPRMLALLATNENAAQDILEALGALVSCLQSTGEDERREFLPLLDRLISAPRAVVRREVLRWASTLFPSSAPEGRYYALRFLGDQDPDLARAAEVALSAGGREAPPFAEMCNFLAKRALNLTGTWQLPGADSEAAQSTLTGRLGVNAKALLDAATLGTGARAQLPPLAAGFSQHDLGRALSFLLRLAEAEGLRVALQDSFTVSSPLLKKPRLETYAAEPIAAFLALLDYLLASAIQGSSAMVTEEMADGSTGLELCLEGLLLSASLSHGHDSVYREVVRRAEVVLLGPETVLHTGSSASANGTLFREGGSAANRMRRLGARVLGTLSVQSPTGPSKSWLGLLGPMISAEVIADAASCRSAGAALAVCELLRFGVGTADEGTHLCRQVLGLLVTSRITDSDALAAACDGLRRLSETRPLVWEALATPEAEGGALSRKSLLDRIYELSGIVTAGLGDTKEAELGSNSRELVHSSWRLLGQLAAWGGDGFADCIDKLIAIGIQNQGEEATAAIGMALSSAASDPTDPEGQVAASRAESLLNRLLKMVASDDEKNADAGSSGASPEGSPASNETGGQQDETAASRKRARLAQREAEHRCGIIWLSVLLRRLARVGPALPSLHEYIEPICRAFVGAVGGLSMFVADCSVKSLCSVYRLVPTESRLDMVKAAFASISNRTVVSNMFVGNPDTQARKEAKEAKDASSGGPNSLKIAAKERVDQLKDLMFLARELQHPPLFMGLLDQPLGSVWTGEILREALDLQASCLPDNMHSHLCPTSLRPKLYPYLFHPNAPLRQCVLALCANYFSCESPQQLASKSPQEWPLIASNLVQSLGSARVTTREASIAAAQTLFRGKTWLEVNFILDELWTITIKLMDDMEPKIQAAVGPLARMMRNLTLRLCDSKVSSAKDVEAAMATVVPLLLRFCERYKHAQPVCFDVMRELIKGAQGTSLLTPHVQSLIPPLLISLSMMENDNLQYYQFHVNAASEEKGKELEAARISNSRDSQSMKLLRNLVPLVTAESAEALAPRTRDLLHRGVGANTRVGVCDFWVSVCAERPTAVPSAGTVVTGMLRSVAGALLDPSREVRGAAASCFASFAKRNVPQELTKVITERLLKQDQEFRTDDVQRNAYRVSLARALWEVCRRCDDSMLESELKASIAAKAFTLRWNSEAEVKTGWEALWNELCPTTMGGVERYYKEICTELSGAFADSVSRVEKVDAAKAVSALCAQLEKCVPRPQWSKDDAVRALHAAVKAAVSSLPVFDGSGVLVRALADAAAVMYRRKRNEAAESVDEEKIGLPLVLSFCSKGSLADRGAAAKAYLEVTSATRLWMPLSEAEKLYNAAAKYVDGLQQEDEKEEQEPGQAPPKRHRGKGQSPAEELLAAVLDFWATSLQQCCREVEDEGDLEPPETAELGQFISSSLSEFRSGSLTLRLAIVRLWKHVLTHLAQERILLKDRLSDDLCGRLMAAIQDASFDVRSERLRRPALELAAALAEDATSGGREVILRGLKAEAEAQLEGVNGIRAIPMALWLERIDDVTREQCASQVATLNSVV